MSKYNEWKSYPVRSPRRTELLNYTELMSDYLCFGIFVMFAHIPRSVETHINIFSFQTTAEGNLSITILRLIGFLIVCSGLFGLSVENPKLVTFDREKAELRINGFSWFGILPYQKPIPFAHININKIFDNKSFLTLPLKSGKTVFIANIIVNRDILDKIIEIIQ